jgi:hypothetical protein
MSAPCLKCSQRIGRHASLLDIGSGRISVKWPPRAYLTRFGRAEREVHERRLLRQETDGVPFGDVVMVRDWLGSEGRVLRPNNELWGWALEMECALTAMGIDVRR